MPVTVLIQTDFLNAGEDFVVANAGFKNSFGEGFVRFRI